MASQRIAAIGADGVASPGRRSAPAAVTTAASFPQLLGRAGDDGAAASGTADSPPQRAAARPAAPGSDAASFAAPESLAAESSAAAGGNASLLPGADPMSKDEQPTAAQLDAHQPVTPLQARNARAHGEQQAGSGQSVVSGNASPSPRKPLLRPGMEGGAKGAVAGDADRSKAAPAPGGPRPEPGSPHPTGAAASGNSRRKPSAEPDFAARFADLPTAAVNLPVSVAAGGGGAIAAASSISGLSATPRTTNPAGPSGEGSGRAGAEPPAAAAASASFADMLHAPSGAGLDAETAAALAAAQTGADSLSGSAQTVSSGFDSMPLRPGSAGAAADPAQPLARDRATAQPSSMAGGSGPADATPASVSLGDLRANAIGAAGTGAAADRLAATASHDAAGAVVADGPAAAAPGNSDPGAASATLSAAAGVAAIPLVISPAPAGAAAPALAASAAVQPTLSEMPETAARHVLGSAQSGGGEMVLQLHPPELGELNIRVAVDGRDVSAWFASPHAAVQQALSLTLGQLHTDLGSAGYSLVGAWVGADASGTGARGETSAAPQRERRKTETAAPQGASTAPLAAESQGISIYV